VFITLNVRTLSVSLSIGAYHMIVGLLIVS
jgi:hypothetical protein